ncbi:hypothetical protein T8S45_11040 [Blastomonas marina]|uniref:hypothetical protein n=1 Tax=Blastomonas marina TaxID=1867408 RepID=UPI002AC9D651|nr:hypothetical protein [Blastomonas marina]WPZ03359.1 hypothetical protein T8S45_11040 [Blastomonas marina]
MSRIRLSLGGALLAFAVPLSAQGVPSDEDDGAEAGLTADEVLAESEPVVGPPLPPECEADPLNNTVVICAPRDDEQFRVPRRIDPERVDAYGDVPRAPDVFGIPNHGIPIPFGSVPEPVLIIDLEAIPEAPPGSDADRVARGLAPRGDDNGGGRPDPVTRIEPDEAPADAPEN